MGKRGGKRSTTFKAGQTIARKPKGPNNKTLILESFAQNIVEGGMEKFQTELNKLTGKEYVNAFMTVFDYVKPKLSRIEVKDISLNEKAPPINIYQIINGTEERIDLSVDYKPAIVLPEKVGNEPPKLETESY